MINKSCKIPFYYNRYYHNGGLENRAYLQCDKLHCRSGESKEFEPGLIFTINKSERKWDVDSGFHLWLYINTSIEPYNMQTIPLIISVPTSRLRSQPFDYTMNFDGNDVNFNVPITINTKMITINVS